MYHYLLFLVHIYQRNHAPATLQDRLRRACDEACGLHLISKLRKDAALYLPPTTPYQGRGRPAIYGERLNPKDIDEKYRISTQTKGNITTEVYQIACRHKRFPDPLNVVCLLKTDTKTQEKSHVLLFSSDLGLDAETLIDYYSLRTPESATESMGFTHSCIADALACGCYHFLMTFQDTYTPIALHTMLKNPIQA